ncbi:transcription-repair coupling factor [Parvularcula sp. IMCC14364]|uniref:transcription-repair coupling factor n=1 Tax=Parvularcula sp. IMCC14364 TaxID=3067902 RepID=UPI0027429822|nr:transcription-repair coupling factor [Parvularcula sp. IMCC14364]
MTEISLTSRISSKQAWLDDGSLTVYGAPEGADALAIVEAARARQNLVVHIARDAARAAATASAISVFASDIPVMTFPAWDCLPYDRVSPSSDVSAQRMAVLSALLTRKTEAPMIVVTSVNAVTMSTPPAEIITKAAFSARPGGSVDGDDLVTHLLANGYARTSTVREPGEFAVRGGLVDIFPPGTAEPLRLDFFGDTLESIRAFDAETQRTTAQRQAINLTAASEILLTDDSIRQFRQKFRMSFGVVTDNPLYEAVAAGRKHAGMEHWLSFFYETPGSFFDFAPDGLFFLDHLAAEAADERYAQVTDYHAARLEDSADKKSSFTTEPYYPVAPETMYLSRSRLEEKLSAHPFRQLTPFAPPEQTRAFDFGARQGRSFAAERSAGNVNVFDALNQHIKMLQGAGKKVIVAGWSEGSADRMGTVMRDHAVSVTSNVMNWRQAQEQATDTAVLVALGVEHGFETEKLAVIAEQDILGDRLVRRRTKKRADNFLTEAASLSIGDLVVHVDHGIARYEGLHTVDVGGAPHDCLNLVYAGGDKLYLPVENIELLSRFGSDDPNAQLDRLGGAGWQNRKARLKDRIKMMAAELIKIAAKRETKKAESLDPPAGAYDEFCARFPYAETEDQENAIQDVLDDLAMGRPMDRLICGDVGFGKTEVALRAAFITAMNGQQVAIIAPTTLLVRQHFRNFMERFAGFPLQVKQLSRMVSTKEAGETRKGITDGTVDIVIGTHALLSKNTKFDSLGLVIVDEEQHFGVKHKERLKEFRADTHVLTLTATPIPRTLQLSMSGIRDLSLIATPPVDRLAVRTSIGPFDSVVARETLLREHYRGGQSFFVAPRIADLNFIAEFLTEQVPEVKFKVAHGQMAASELEDIMNAFYDGKFDVLVATTIIESGIDVPSANTLIVHRADMFGLAQLYQIRGRVGRSKARAYAYLTTSARKKMTAGAERRLKVLQSLDTLGAGFTLASHDLDIRGAGNLLGEEQSGNIKEVGVELYQHMLEEAVASFREGGALEETWSPQINIGAAVLIPDTYIEDLDLRMSLYRRLSNLTEQDELDAFGAELIDRFGALPAEVEHLLEIVAIKSLCRQAGVAKIDAGPKGAVVSFRNNEFANPAGLVEFIAASPYDVKLRPDQTLVFKQAWPGEKQRLKGCRKILMLLLDIARND